MSAWAKKFKGKAKVKGEKGEEEIEIEFVVDGYVEQLDDYKDRRKLRIEPQPPPPKNWPATAVAAAGSDTPIPPPPWKDPGTASFSNSSTNGGVPTISITCVGATQRTGPTPAVPAHGVISVPNWPQITVPHDVQTQLLEHIRKLLKL